MDTLSADRLNADLSPPPGCGIIPFSWYHPALADHPDPRLVEQSALGPAFTLMADGKVAVMWGWVLPWKGLAEGWMIATPAVRPHALWFTRAAKRFCAISAQALHLRRIQIHVQTSNPMFERWARAVGFKLEARLPAFCEDGSEVALMAMLFSQEVE